MQNFVAMMSKRLRKRLQFLDDIVHHAHSMTYAFETLIYQLDTRERYYDDTKDHAHDAVDSFDSLQKIPEDCMRDNKLGTEWRQEWISSFREFRESIEKLY